MGPDHSLPAIASSESRPMSLLQRFPLILLFTAFFLGGALPGWSREPVTPGASQEARDVLHYLDSLQGKQTLSGQMATPWGVDEMALVEKITGRLPALQGHDLIHEKDNPQEVAAAIAWWQAGGIPTVMWHWGAPTHGDGYEQSKTEIDVAQCFIEGSPEHTAMWADLRRIADHLTTLRDAGVPVLWRPLHEFDGGWFWYGKGGKDDFTRLWRTMFDYFARERKLTNLLWVLCHSHTPLEGWDPGREYYDLAGADTYGDTAGLFEKIQTLHGPDTPIPLHECGTLPDPDAALRNGTMWSWWMLWHTDHLTSHDPAELKRIYHHDSVITRDELPRFLP